MRPNCETSDLERTIPDVHWFATISGILLLAATAGLAGPCDIFATGGTPCVAAHSTVRALYAAYSGSLYQVRRATDKTTKDIGLISAGGYVNSAAQDSFCAKTTCTISYIYDQSPKKNDLPLSPPVHWLPNGGTEASATMGSAKVGRHDVYGVYVQPDAGNTYRNDKTTGVATGDQAESMYMVVDGKHYNGRCCFDYGNVETTGNDDGSATMEALNFGTIPNWSYGSGSGPWVMIDLENGVFAGGQLSGSVSVNTPLVATYVTVMANGPSGNKMTLKGANAQSGTLAIKYDGVRPPGYSPMKKEGAVELGTGGDGSAGGDGTFFEGAVTSGVPSDAVEDSVQANIVAAEYGSSTSAISTGGASATFPASVFFDMGSGAYKIAYDVEAPSPVHLSVIDLQGRRVTELADGMVATGSHVATWDASRVRAGAYTMALEIAGSLAWSKVVLVGH